MKQVIILILFSLKGYAQNNADAIIGKWLKTPKEDLIIQVYKTGNEYKGKITWTKGNDPKKPVGYVILENLKYNANKKCGRVEKFMTPIQEVHTKLKRI